MMPFMSDLPTYADARKAILDVLNEIQNSSDKAFGREHVIKKAAESLGQWGDRHGGRLLMDAWDDLYRAGVVSYGLNMSNLGFGWAHLTEHGVATVKSGERDPSNPTAYAATVDPFIKDNAIAVSYLREALDTYIKGSVKAAAVMLGCTAEALTLALRDKLKAKINANAGTPPSGLDDWRISVVLRTTEGLLDQRVKDMPRPMRERYESYWSSYTGLFRMTRNDAGHPTSIDPVTRETIHASLLLFHEHARLCHELSTWIDSTY